MSNKLTKVDSVMNKRGQLAIFVIIGIVIVAGVLVYLFVFNKPADQGISGEFLPAYNSYLKCIEGATNNAANLAGTQAGYINLPDYQSASDYAPFSSQLNFLGFSVPYWYYVSGNGIIKEQVPSLKDVENGIAYFIQNRISDCNVDAYLNQGFSVNLGTPSVKVSVTDTKITTDVASEFVISKGDKTERKTTHQVSVSSKLGKFFKVAKQIYNKEKDEAFLENYSVDVLRLNAPVDGVELSCDVQVWNAQDVEKQLKDALEANIAEIRVKKTPSGISNKSKYYYVDTDVDENVNLIYSQTWPTKLQISGSSVNGNLMTAETVGNQPGLGVMGFCYAPYHFVYDLSFPVMVQISDNEELFQFPVAVIIDGNLPRKAELSEISDEPEFDFCKYNTQDIAVNIYDINLNKVDGNVSYECFDQECRIGESESGVLSAKAPACVNGYLVVKKQGYEEKRQLYSSNEEQSADIVLDKQYEAAVNVIMDDKPVNQRTIVTFTRNDSITSGTYSAVIPDNKNIKLTEGLYDIRVYVYSNSSIVIPGSTRTECTDVPQTGLWGFFGGTKQKCLNIQVPETKIENALSGGGSTQTYIFPENLANGKVDLIVHSLPVPNSLEQLQYNFEAFDLSDVGIEFE